MVIGAFNNLGTEKEVVMKITQVTKVIIRKLMPSPLVPKSPDGLLSFCDKPYQHNHHQNDYLNYRRQSFTALLILLSLYQTTGKD